MIAIPVDTNSMARNGLVVASTRRVKGIVRVGDKVRADDSAEKASFDAVVADIDDRRIYLEIDWESQFQNVEMHGEVLAWPNFKHIVYSAQVIAATLAPTYAAFTPIRALSKSEKLTMTGVTV